MSQNSQRLSWTFEEVDAKLKTIMVGIFHNIDDAAKEYGVDYFSEIQWENSVQPEEFMKCAEKLLTSGGCNIALWDSYPHRVSRLCEWYITSKLGSLEHIKELKENKENYRRIHKVLKYSGEDMSLHNPNWYG